MVSNGKGITMSLFQDSVAVVLAGKDKDPSVFGGEIGAPSKFFMDFNGKIIGDTILQAVDGLDCRALYLIGPQPYLSQYKPVTRNKLIKIRAQGGRLNNLDSAVKHAKDSGYITENSHILAVMGDLPLLTTKGIESYLEECEGKDADVFVGMIPSSNLESMQSIYQHDSIPFPGKQETYMHSDVYLLKLDALTEKGRKIFEDIMSIRRISRDSISDVIGAGKTVLEIGGVNTVKTFLKVIAGFALYSKGFYGASDLVCKNLEQEINQTIESLFGLKIEFVFVKDPSTGLEFDYEWQLNALEKAINS